MYHLCVVETEGGTVVIKSKPGHVKGCSGHVPNSVNPVDYKFLKNVDGVYVVCKDAKMKYLLEKMNEPVSE